MGALLQDLRYAVRALQRAPGFGAVAVITLALGIGANTAIFSLVHAVLLKPLPYREPSRLMIAWDTYLPGDKSLPTFPKMGVAPPELELWQKQTDIFNATAWYRYVPMDLDLTGPGAEALSVRGGFLSANFLSVMGVAPRIGSGFGPAESPDSLLLSDHLWRTRFAAEPAIIGTAVRLNDQVFRVIGVMPATFQFPDWADVWLPPGPLLGDELTNPVRHAAAFIGRLRPRVTAQQASARLTALSSRLAAEHPKTSTGWGMRVANLQQDLTAGIRPSLLMLTGAVGLVLLIACGNVANLLLARASGRGREIAVRSALGAGASRIARQLLTECILLSLAGGAVGSGLGAVGLKLLSPIQAPLDGTVLLFLLGISVFTGLAFGIAPLIHALRKDPISVLKSSSAAGGASRIPAALVIGEFALAMVLVAGAGILARSFVKLLNVDPGFRPRGLLTMRISFPPSRNVDELFRRIEERVRRIPGVDSFASSNALPLQSNHGNTGRFNVPGSPLIHPDALPAAELRFVSPDYFRAMGIALHAGRAFSERDLNQPVVIINESMAREFWPGMDPVGEKFITGPWGPKPAWSTIVGVVADVKQFGLDAFASRDIYFPALYPASLVIHTAGDAEALIGPVRDAIRGTDPDLPVSEVRTMDQVLGESTGPRRWTMAMLALFAALSMTLALVGIYGVMSWSVAQRTREIGIRVALGASRREVLRAVMWQGLKLSAIGLAIGIAGAFALRRFLASLVFGVSPADPVIYLGAALLMFAVALAATYFPARRAGKVDPLIALRWE